MGNHWLVKSEPGTYSFAKLAGDRSTAWDGIRNFEARNNLRLMKKGDLVLFYHSGDGKEIVGLARVGREAYPDPSDKEWVAVDLEVVKALDAPVALADVKKHAALKKMAFVKKGRLSVSPVTKKEFDTVLALAKTTI
jgi:predicted RNA-binding protein with PUA-like domain